MIGKDLFEKHVLSGDKRFEVLAPAQLNRLYEAWSKEATSGAKLDTLLDVQHIYVLAMRAGILKATPEKPENSKSEKIKAVKKEDTRMKEFKMGTLAGKPDMKIVNVKGVGRSVANATIFIYDKTAPENENGFKYGIPIAITAWGDKAEELAKFEKGEIIGVFGQPKAEVYEKRVRYGLTVSSVYAAEEAKDINKQINQILSAYEKGDIERIYGEAEKEDKAAEETYEPGIIGTETVAEYPAAENGLPYDIVVEKIRFGEPEQTQEKAAPAREEEEK